MNAHVHRLRDGLAALCCVVPLLSCSTIQGARAPDLAATSRDSRDETIDVSDVEFFNAWTPPHLESRASFDGAVRATSASSSVAEAGIDFELEDSILEEIELAAGDLHPSAVPARRARPILAATGTVASFDIPMADDPRVGQWVAYFTGRGRQWYERWLERSTRYGPIFLEILAEHGLPKDLVFLSMIESGFSPKAYSWAHAAGPWQFVAPTARRFGLEVGFWTDERRDFVLSTHAAAQYLADLHARFGDWYLAWAAYNAGDARVLRALRQCKTRDFWRLSRTRHLMPETRQYVPKLLAAARIARRPEQFGFDDVAYLPPLEWDVVTTTISTGLDTIGRACGNVSEEDIVELNPALKWRITPPGARYTVRVPRSLGEVCQKGLDTMAPSERMTFRYHAIREGETLAAVAALYRTSTASIAAFNRFSPSDWKDLDEVVVPVAVDIAAEFPIVDPPPRAFAAEPDLAGGRRRIIHRVRAGESLWTIAKRYRVSTRDLRSWNGLGRSTRLKLGQKLRVQVGKRALATKVTARPDVHRVRRGDSLESIARRYGVTVDKLVRTNTMTREDPLLPGRVLRIE